MTEETKEVAVRQETAAVVPGGAFASIQNFENAQRMANAFAKSNLVPDTFKNNVGDCVIAMEMSQRMGANPLAVMQNIYIVHGKPAWSSQFLISCVNGCGRFSPLRYKMTGEPGSAERTCVAWAKDLGDGEILESPEISIKMAREEGWATKPGSKWKNMPDLMLRYRAATFFARLYAPELTMGMQTAEEIKDITSDVSISSPVPGNLTVSLTDGTPVEKVDPDVLPPKEPTPKEKLQMECAELGLDPNGTVAELKARLEDELNPEPPVGDLPPGEHEPENEPDESVPEGGPFAAPRKES